MLRTNTDRLAKISVQGEVSSPKMWYPYGVTRYGKPFTHIGCGGICYNIKVGVPAFGWIADHIEPGVTVVFSQKEAKREERFGLRIPTCIGNEAKIISGEAKGEIGVVTGLHTGVLIDFTDNALEKLAIGDKVLIKAYGLGLEMLNYPQIKCLNIDPSLLEKLELKESNGCIEVGVSAEIPAQLMGSGIGAISSHDIDYDIMTSDEELIKELLIDKICIGDLVAIKDHFNEFGPCYKRGAITIGVVIHGDSDISGHGPGILPILTTKEREIIKPVISASPNIGRYLKCGIYRED